MESKHNKKNYIAEAKEMYKSVSPIFDKMIEILHQITTELTANAKQCRGLKRDLGIIASAIASFTLFVFKTSLVKNPNLLMVAVIFLIAIIGYIFLTLTMELQKDKKDYFKLYKNYMAHASDWEAVKKAILEFKHNPTSEYRVRAINLYEEKFRTFLTRQEKSDKDFPVPKSLPDRSLNIIVGVFVVALLLIALSFFNWPRILCSNVVNSIR